MCYGCVVFELFIDFFFFFKQKTAYEMRISDWSSDVCSSDLFRLDEAAAVKLGDASVRQRAGNFITREVMQRWRERHPDWLYIDKGDGGMAMSQVPEVETAGYRPGPAWFLARPDKALHESMAQWMDQPVRSAERRGGKQGVSRC